MIIIFLEKIGERNMQYVIEGFKPKKFFEHFEEISAIPRGSSNEKAISDFLVEFGNKLGLSVYQDDLFNVIIKKPANHCKDDIAPVMLQGHLDMVCEKNIDSQHDFLTDGIELIVENGILHANGTTLGADNGVAVAMMMTILEDTELIHPPLECVFTVQEETGLTGAAEINASQITARRMINMDSGGEGHATISCAGGLRINLYHPCEWEAVSGPSIQISIRGLLGGHSGGEIHKGHANSNKLMARILLLLSQRFEIHICDLNGGNKDNAIPRECDAVICLKSQEEIQSAKEMIIAEAKDILQEISQVEKDFYVTVKAAEATHMMSCKATKEIINLLYLAPNGVKSRNPVAGDFVVSSLNMGVIKTLEQEIRVTFSPRSSIASLQNQTKKELNLLAEVFSFRVEMGAEYPGWAYTNQSAIRQTVAETYQELTGKELICESIHAGLECGLFSAKLPGLDAIAIGPNASDAHTPKESLDLASCERFYLLVCKVLEKLAK